MCPARRSVPAVMIAVSLVSMHALCHELPSKQVILH
jgi:hypothetical protein